MNIPDEQRSHSSGASSVASGNEASVSPAAASGELLPCPFCGVVPAIFKWKGGGVTRYMIECQNDDGCVIVLQHSESTKKKAIKAWNTRAVAQPARSEPEPNTPNAEKLREALESARNRLHCGHSPNDIISDIEDALYAARQKEEKC